MIYETKLELSSMCISKTSNSQSNLTWYVVYLRGDNQLDQLQLEFWKHSYFQK